MLKNKFSSKETNYKKIGLRWESDFMVKINVWGEKLIFVVKSKVFYAEEWGLKWKVEAQNKK